MTGAHATGAHSIHEHATDEQLLARVLQPYKDHCKYLKSARVTAEGTAGTGVTAHCTFEIPESCYIDDTGHLNAVEITICYNQMMYYTVAAAIQWGILEAFEGWTMDDFWKRQLPDILIARFASKFRRPVTPRSFSGAIEFRSVQHRSPGGAAPLLIAETAYRYHDAEGGRCDGEATLAFTGLPG
ncbi:FcoT family thioesterase [Streptomyces sp. NPDC047515]|uniref:(2E)-enoyl-ACP glycyltransferase n=1 Tax=Streptomyces sp. NPDC047515 TaxID=3155380 RepID=UPI003405FDAF